MSVENALGVLSFIRDFGLYAMAAVMAFATAWLFYERISDTVRRLKD